MPENGSRVRTFKQRFAAVRPLLSMAIFSFVVLLGLSFVVPVFAQTAGENLDVIGTQAGIGGGADLFTIIGRVINVALGFVGIVLLFMLLYAGYLWMTSEGDPKKVDAAKAMIRNAIIGLLIIVSSFAIVNFI